MGISHLSFFENFTAFMAQKSLAGNILVPFFQFLVANLFFRHAGVQNFVVRTASDFIGVHLSPFLLPMDKFGGQSQRFFRISLRSLSLAVPINVRLILRVLHCGVLCPGIILLGYPFDPKAICFFVEPVHFMKNIL